MKRFEIVITGANEDKIGHEIMKGIYSAIQNQDYADVSVHASSIERDREISIPEFIKQGRRCHT